jgi:predicted AAA+ superfamily ATPase
MVEIKGLSYGACRAALRSRIAEPPPGRIQVVTGPRQVGKTTLLLEIAGELGPGALYAAADGPEAALPGFWERLWADAETRARQHATVLLIDEIHLLPGWAPRLKARWDHARRLHLPLHVVVTGSSALRVGAGSRESLAGRFERLTLSHWPAAALAETFGLTPSDAAVLSVQYGGYPGALAYREDPARWRAYVRDAIIEPAIGRDILAGGVVRKPGLLRQVFAVAVTSPVQIVSLKKIQGQLHDRGALETVAQYLDLLADAYLVAAIEKYAGRLSRRRAAPPKLIALNNGILSAMHPDGPPGPDREPARFGAWVENACVAAAINTGQQVTYWREEPLEVDAIYEGSWGAWAMEVKSGAFEPSDLRGLLEFCRRHPRFRPLVVTAPGDEARASHLGLASVSWHEFLLSGPPRRSG